MNKTININLGGYFFHIDEIAYQKLRRYLDAISKSLSDDPQGKNEIISDIETRISELLSEKITDARQVVNEQDISDVIKIMGEPEDYADSEETYKETSYKYTRKQSNSKKLFRDGDNKFMGGVAAGIAQYFDVDVIWIRLAFILLFFGGGFSLLLYIILWVLLPEAKTTAEKLQMEGEPVNIDNIEKKIRKEFESITESIKDGASEVTKKVNEGTKKHAKRASSGFQDFLDTLGKIILAFFNVIGKFIGVIIIIVSASVLISFVIALFSDEFLSLPPFMHDSIMPHWLLAVCGLILAGFPFLILFILGLRILSSNVKQFSKTTSLTLLGIWIVALLMVIFTGIEFGVSKAHNGNKLETKNLYVAANDTLRINVREVYIGEERKLYSNYVKVDVERSTSDKTYIKVRKRSEGRNISRANKSAENLEYEYSIVDNKIVLNGYFLSNYKNLIKDEAVYVTLYVPEGITIFFDESSQSFLNNIDNTGSIYDNDMVDHYFLMTKEGLDCSDCIEVKEEKTVDENLEEE